MAESIPLPVQKILARKTAEKTISAAQVSDFVFQCLTFNVSKYFIAK